MKIAQIQSEIARASESLETFRKEISGFFQALPDPFFIIDEHGKYLEVLGGSSRELYEDGRFLKDKYVSDVFYPRMQTLVMQHVQQAVATGTMQIVEYELSSEDFVEEFEFKTSWYEGRVVRLSEPGAEVGVVVWLAINITQRKHLEKQLHELSIRDTLTGLYNRRFFNDEVNRQHKEYSRYGTVYSISLIDLDYFKRVNDTYGHDTGDRVLQQFAETAKRDLRETDLLARFGGEEFILLMPNTRSDEAVKICERLRLAVREQVTESEKGSVSVTVSIGVSEVDSTDPRSPEVVIKAADEAVYLAKSSGRDQVRVYQRISRGEP